MPPSSKYRSYINSAAWRAKRIEYLSSGLSTACHWCKKPWQSGYHLHHTSYENLGREPLSDLKPMCSFCHKVLHKVHKATGKAVSIGTLTSRYASGKKPSGTPTIVRQSWLHLALLERKKKIREARIKKLSKLKK